MSEYLIQKDTLTAIANAIREKTGETGQLAPMQMADKIKAIDNKIVIPFFISFPRNLKKQETKFIYSIINRRKTAFLIMKV